MAEVLMLILVYTAIPTVPGAVLVWKANSPVPRWLGFSLLGIGIIVFTITSLTMVVPSS